MPKAAVWRTRRQAKKFLEKKKKKKEAGEERESDDNEDADAEDKDGDRDGDGDGGDEGDGPGAREGAAGANWDAGMGWRSLGWRVRGWWVTGRWSARAKGGNLRGVRPRKRSSLGTYKDTNPMCPCRHPNLQCMFHLPFIHTLLFVSRACSGGVTVTCSGGVPVVFRQRLFLKANVFRTTTRNATNLKTPAGCP